MMQYAPADVERLAANVPSALRELPVWMLWKAVPGKGDAKAKKLPYYTNGKPRSGKLDTPVERAKLVPFADALSGFDPRRYAGLGVALGPVPDTALHLSGIDLDNSVRDDEIAPLAREVIAAGHGAYTEISPSGAGLKLFGTGDIGKETRPELEIYSGERFFTVTGERIEGDRLADLTDAAAVARAFARRSQNAKPQGDAVVQGSRNNTLFSFACSLRARGTPDPDAWALLQRRNLDCTPPLDERELRQLFDRAWKYAPGYNLTDLGNRDRLVAQHGDDIRYLVGGGWHVWSGRRYEADDKRRVVVMMGDVARGIYAEAAAADDADRRKALAGWAKASESRNKIESAVALAESHPAVIDRLCDYDTNPNLIGLRNGVYDLQRDEFRDASRDDRITKQMHVEYDSHATCPRWEQFQCEIHAEDAAMVAFKQRLWGYAISGDTSEQKFFVPFGDGANGKGTEQETLAELFGDYAIAIEPDVLARKQHTNQNAASSDIAELRGARLIYTSELEDGHQLAEKLIKRLTGQDTIRARFMYRERFEFKPVGKIFIATNYRPEIRGTDHAIWRRVCLIPYTQRFDDERKDPTLRAKLLAERAGIFNWLVAGHRAWRAQGLSPPDAVSGAGEDYRVEQDRVGNFLRECCKVDDKGCGRASRVRASHLYALYASWSRVGGVRWLSRQRFFDHLARDHGLQRMDGNTGRLADIVGLSITTTDYDRGEIDA